jgi:hypothetical protein
MSPGDWERRVLPLVAGAAVSNSWKYVLFVGLSVLLAALLVVSVWPSFFPQ